MEKINIILNGLDPTTERFKINKKLVKLWNKFPDMFYKDMQLWGIYGSFSTEKHAAHELNGHHRRTGIRELMDVNKFMCDVHMHVILDAGSDNIHENSVYDYYDSCIYDVFNNPANYVSTDNQMLKDYMKREFPKFKIMPSYYSGMTPEQCYELINNGQLTFLQPEFDYEGLKDCDTYYAILTINPWCKLSCGKYFAHLKFDQNSLYNYHNEMELRVDTQHLPNRWLNRDYCPNKSCSINDKCNDTKFLTPNKIREYHKLGVQFFMFENFIFESTYNIIETYMKTLVVPEAYDQFRFMMYSTI